MRAPTSATGRVAAAGGVIGLLVLVGVCGSDNNGASAPSSTGPPPRALAEASRISTRSTDVCRSSRSFGSPTSSHRPGARCSLRTRSPWRLSPPVATVARPMATTER